MRIIRFDQGFVFDDINSYFGADGEPAYQLEPGDPGYKITGAEAPPQTTITKHTTMNETPQELKPLLALARVMRTGATTLEDVIGLHHYKAAGLNTAILKLEGDPNAEAMSNANKGSMLVYKLAEDASRDAASALKTYSDGPVKELLTGYRKILEGVHGLKHNAGWAAAGFTTNRRVPEKHENRQTLLAAMRSYLAAHPGHEGTLPRAEGPALQVSAAAALALMAPFQAAFDLINSTDSAQVLTKGLRDDDHQGLYRFVSKMIGEIGGRLSADDPRWEVFGLNIPANPNPPEGVTVLSLTAGAAGQEVLSWEHARRATYYRIFIKVEGVDEDFRFLARDTDFDHTIKGLTPGTVLHAYVVAANPAGEAAPSPVVTKVVGV